MTRYLAFPSCFFLTTSNAFNPIHTSSRKLCSSPSSSSEQLSYYSRKSAVWTSLHEADSFPVEEFRTQNVTTNANESTVISPNTENDGGSFWTSLIRDLPPTSILLLNMVAILWGSQHAIIKSVVEDSDAGAFTFLRFGLAALFAAPYTPGLFTDRSKQNPAQNDVSTTWRWGAEMGLWMFLGFSFQAIGLASTTAQRSGFLLYLNVKFVPFLASLLMGREISNATWLSAIVAFSGTALLAYGGDQGSLDLNVGDVWSVAAAVSSAMFILRLETASSKVSNAASLNAACIWVVTLFAGIWTVGQDVMATGHGANLVHTWGTLESIAQAHPWELLYLSGVTTAFANWIQTKGQRDISAERASIIYAMDPVYGAAFSSWWLGERLGGITGWIGAGLITLAAATNGLIDLSKANEDENDDESEVRTSNLS